MLRKNIVQTLDAATSWKVFGLDLAKHDLAVVAIPADGSELGEGQHSFTFQVQMADGTAYHYTVHTDEETVGAALVALGLADLLARRWGPNWTEADVWTAG